MGSDYVEEGEIQKLKGQFKLLNYKRGESVESGWNGGESRLDGVETRG